MKDFKFLKTQEKIEPNLNGRTYCRNLYVNDDNFESDLLNDPDFVDQIKCYILNIYLFGTVITLLVKYLVNAGF